MKLLEHNQLIVSHIFSPFNTCYNFFNESITRDETFKQIKKDILLNPYFRFQRELLVLSTCLIICQFVSFSFSLAIVAFVEKYI